MKQKVKLFALLQRDIERFIFFLNLGDVDEAIDGPDSGYDITVDDETVDSELLDNQHGQTNPQIQQVQHIAHVQNLQQFAGFPIQPIKPIYFKQNVAPAEKSAANIVQTENKISETKTVESNTEEVEKIAKTEQSTKMEKTEQPKKVEKIVPTTNLPAPMNEILGINATAKI